MGKYALVASHYDMYRNEFLNETTINIPNIDLTLLSNIDHFTSSKTSDEIFQIIKEYNNITNQNFLSIKYYKNQTSDSIYYKVIYNDPIIYKMSGSVEDKMIGTKQHSKAPAVPMDKDFILEYSIIEKMLFDRNIEPLIERMGENHPLVHYARNYLSTEANDYQGLNECTNLLKNEFSRYKTFRGWIVSKNKPFKKRNKQTIIQKQEKIVPKTLEENEKEYENKHPDYQKKLIQDYNLKYLDDDKEEFIEEDEMEQMGYHR
jgi:hypothetical protein